MKRVLLIEDNPVDVYLVQEALKSASVDCELSVIPDGREAMKLFIDEVSADTKPDLVLLDLNLPSTNGFMVLQAIRSNRHLSNTPVAVLTSSTATEEKERMAGLGVSKYIVKPMDLDDYLKIGETVRNLLN